MKNLLYVFLVVAAMAISCTNGNSNGNGNVADADSTYQWENVRKYLKEEPERALKMLDTAEIRGVMDMNEADERQEALSRDSLAQMLATNYNAVGLIVEQSGFSSRSHFNTLFREKFKMTPSEYRNIAKEKNL